MPIRDKQNNLCFKIFIAGIEEGPLEFLKNLQQRPDQLQIHEMDLNERGKVEPKKTQMFTILYEHQRFHFYCCAVKKASHGRKSYNYTLDLSDAVIFVWDSTPDHWNANVDAFHNLLRYFGPKIIPDTNGHSDVPFLCCATNRDVPNPTPIEKIREVMHTAKLSNTFVWEIIANLGPNLKRPFVFIQRELILKSYTLLQSGEFQLEYDAQVAQKFFNHLAGDENDEEDLLFMTPSGFPLILTPDIMPRGFHEYLASLEKPH